MEAFSLTTVEAYEELALTVELTVQQLLQAHHYNTVGNFVRFFEEFCSSGENNLFQFFRTYTPPITPEHHTCVGLGLTLLHRLSSLESKFPGLSSRLHLVSCEEAVDDINGYMSDDPDPTSTEKEHVLVALQVKIDGRNGLMLLDPGYHVARVVTVMLDELYPHTGWFMQSEEGHCRKDYNYTFSAMNNKYVIWKVKEKRGSVPEKVTFSAIFVAKPFNSAIAVTERRNLVYNFRSLLARNTKGHLTAGIYFPLLDNGISNFTLFYQDGTIKKREKMSFGCFKNFPFELDLAQEKALTLCNEQLSFENGHLTMILHHVANIMSDQRFMKQLLQINDHVNDMAEEN